MLQKAKLQWRYLQTNCKEIRQKHTCGLMQQELSRSHRVPFLESHDNEIWRRFKRSGISGAPHRRHRRQQQRKRGHKKGEENMRQRQRGRRWVRGSRNGENACGGRGEGGGLICVRQSRLPLLSCWHSSSYLHSFTCCSSCTFCTLSLLSERPGGADAGDAAVTAICTTHCMSGRRSIFRRNNDLTRSKLRSSFDSSPTSCKSSFMSPKLSRFVWNH